MKPCVNRYRLRLVLILIVIVLISLETAFARDEAGNVTGSAQTKTREKPAAGTLRVNDANHDQEKKDVDLLDELIEPESANKGDQTVKEESCGSVTCAEDIPQ